VNKKLEVVTQRIVFINKLLFYSFSFFFLAFIPSSRYLSISDRFRSHSCYFLLHRFLPFVGLSFRALYMRVLFFEHFVCLSLTDKACSRLIFFPLFTSLFSPFLSFLFSSSPMLYIHVVFMLFFFPFSFFIFFTSKSRADCSSRDIEPNLE